LLWQSTDTGDYAPTTNKEDMEMMQELDLIDGIYGSQIANWLVFFAWGMGFEDYYYYAAFTDYSAPVFKISPGTAVGRMDRRGGESTFLEISADPKGNKKTRCVAF
jgi:hypothetical protein